MAHSYLLRTVCTVAMLAAAPAFAQSNNAPASTGQDNTTNAPPAQAMPNTTAPQGGMAGQGGTAGNNSQASSSSQPMHRSAMAAHHHAMRSGRSDTSQDSEVDRLNEQSYQAAQQGQTFNAPNSGPSGQGISGGGMSGGSAPGGTGSGGGTSGGSTGGGKL